MGKKVVPLFLLIIIFVLGFTDVGSHIVPNFADDISVDTELSEEEGIVIRVIDGDTVIAVDSKGKEERIRLLLVDTPESVHPDKSEELFGKEASEFAKEYLQVGQKITIERGNPERDNYERLLAYIWVGDVNFNQLMIDQGYARVGYIFEPNTKYLDEFRATEANAKEKRLNIWSIDGYVTEEGFDMSIVD